MRTLSVFGRERGPRSEPQPGLDRPRRPPAGILAERQLAHPALLRMLSRARRHHAALLLVQLRPVLPQQPGFDAFLARMAVELRIGDLAWQEHGGAVMLLLEDAPREATPILARLRKRARSHGVELNWRSARFPEQGLTLQALLEAVQWAA